MFPPHVWEITSCFCLGFDPPAFVCEHSARNNSFSFKDGLDAFTAKNTRAGADAGPSEEADCSDWAPRSGRPDASGSEEQKQLTGVPVNSVPTGNHDYLEFSAKDSMTGIPGGGDMRLPAMEAALWGSAGPSSGRQTHQENARVRRARGYSGAASVTLTAASRCVLAGPSLED